MKKKLVVVESPTKARTLGDYLGPDYQVLACYGHVRDLKPKEGAVDPEHHFAMHYEPLEKSAHHVEKIIQALKKSQAIYLAPDPDREGEAIAWHLLELLKERHALTDEITIHRIAFHQITRDAVKEALQHPRNISTDLVNAQQARRALDYLVGFNLSPLLWRKIRTGLSAGRVQSPALRLIVERELEIEAFKPQEYWSIAAQLNTQQVGFQARLLTYQNQKVEQFSFTHEAQASAVKNELDKAAHGELIVHQISKKQRLRNPSPPFTTSTLQQEASRKLGFSAQRTMRLAQQLYEGIHIDSGQVGLITYMRTDSVHMAQEAIQDLRHYIQQQYGNAYVPEKPRFYKTKTKNAQEAHEAIRPTLTARSPEALRQYLDDAQFKLYSLIWKRTLASQMQSATLETVAIDMRCGPTPAHQFRATGSTILFPGFIAVYQESQEDQAPDSDEKILPPLQEGQSIKLNEVSAEQHFTEPPPRYSEASLVKTLEEYGIGRPSTYASIISTLQDRGYVTLESRRFTPTDIGRIVSRFLTDHFTRYVDYDFTAHLEDELDSVARGEANWTDTLEKFWRPFIQLVHTKMEQVSRTDVIPTRELGLDPKSGKPVSVRIGRFGPYVQIGTKEDPEKPTFASLRPGQKMHEITLPQALILFQLPRTLGTTADGATIAANIGRFGPYIKYGEKYVSLKKEQDPYTVTLEEALTLIEEKKIADAKRTILTFPGSEIKVLRGRFGAYITDGKKNAKIPKDQAPETLTLEQCTTLIANAPDKVFKRGLSSSKGKKASKEPKSKKAATGIKKENTAAGKTSRLSTKSKKPAAKSKKTAAEKTVRVKKAKNL